MSRPLRSGARSHRISGFMVTPKPVAKGGLVEADGQVLRLSTPTRRTIERGLVALSFRRREHWVEAAAANTGPRGRFTSTCPRTLLLPG